jgi:hypothetical protein
MPSDPAITRGWDAAYLHARFVVISLAAGARTGMADWLVGSLHPGRKPIANTSIQGLCRYAFRRRDLGSCGVT